MASIGYRAVEAWLRLITLEGATICKVESKKHRKWIKVDDISVKKVRDAVLALTEVVEDSVKGEMKHKKSGVFYDGWTNAGAHYISLFAICMMKEEEKMVLIGVSPILEAKTEDDGYGCV